MSVKGIVVCLCCTSVRECSGSTLFAEIPLLLESSESSILARGASFLRVIRLARLMRIFKSAKYLDMVQVWA